MLCNHCENIMLLLQTIIEIQHFPCLKIVKFCTLSNRSMKCPTSGKNYVDNKTIYCGTPGKKIIKMLIIYPNCKIYFHKWCQFNLQEMSFLIIYIFLYLICVSIFNEDTNPGMLTCTDTKIWFHKDNLVKNFAPKNTKFFAVISIFTRGQYWPSGIVVACVCLSVCVSVRASITSLSAR